MADASAESRQTDARSDPHRHERSDEEPTTEELEEPSVAKEPGEEPRAPVPHDPEPDHEAVGIGVIGDTPAAPGAESISSAAVRRFE